jgi:hypothetical protein
MQQEDAILTPVPLLGYLRGMTTIQRAALAAIKTHGTLRKAGAALGINHAHLYRISQGQRKNVSPETAAKFGLLPVYSWKRLWSR